MKLLLHADIEGLGYLGDVVEVNDGYARNYLLPQRKAIEPSEENIQAIAEEKAHQAEVRRLAREEMVKAAEGVNGVEVTIEARANEQGHLFGSVAETNIAEALQEAGHTVATKHVVLPEHLRQLGTFDVDLRFAGDVKAAVKVTVIGLDGATAPAEEAPEPVAEEPVADEQAAEEQPQE